MCIVYRVYGQFITCCLIHSFFLILFPCSSMKSLLWETFRPELHQEGPSPLVAVLHKLTHCGVLTGSQVLTANLLQCEILSPPGHRSCQESAPSWFPSFIYQFQHGVLQGLQLVCSMVSLHGLHRIAHFTLVFTRGSILCLAVLKMIVVVSAAP